MELDDDYIAEESTMVAIGNALIISDEMDIMKARMSKLNQLRKTRHFCDVVLQVGSAEIHAHRAVLSCASPYFYELFTTDDEKKTAREDKVVYRLSGSFEHESLERLVQFAYTGYMELPARLVKNVYVAANKLKMEQVSRSCGNYFMSQLSPDNWLAVRTIPGIASNDQLLVDMLDKYVQEQTDLTRVTKDAPSSIPRLQLRVVQNTADEASVTSHAICLLSLEWVRRQMEEEDVSLSALIEKKHLLYLNLDNSLHDCSDIKTGDAHDTEMVQDYKKISRKINHVNTKGSRKISTPLHPVKPRMMLYSRSISDEEEQQEAEWKLVTHAEVDDYSFVAIVTLNNQVSVLSVVQVVNPPSPTTSRTPHHSRPASVEKVDSYTLIPHMSSSKCGSGAGCFGDSLLVCGGYDRGECLKEVELYSPKENTWHKLSDMKQGRGRFDLTVLNGLAYVVGGSDGAHELNTVEVLNQETKLWSTVAPLPLARSNIGVCSTNSKVYGIGGWNGYCGIRQCDVYDPTTNRWTTIAPMHTGRYQAGVAALNGQVYAVGGSDSWNCLSSVEVLDTELNQWRMVTSISTPRRGCGLAVFKGKLFMMGGSDGQQSLCSTEIYDPDTNAWTHGPPMTTCRANVGAAVVGGRLYAVGGFSGKNFLNSIEYLDPDTMEWTNFTPKPEGYRSRKTSKIMTYNGGSTTPPSTNGGEYCVEDDNSNTELDSSIAEEVLVGGPGGELVDGPSSVGCGGVANGIINSRCETANVH